MHGAKNLIGMRLSGLAITAMIATMLTGCVSGGGAISPAAAPAGPVISGVLAGSFGTALDEGDRQRAHDAQSSALASGQRTTWRGNKGNYGFVDLVATGSGTGNCRDYSHTIYLDGRPQRASGQACRQADGSWLAAN